jgi:hypothetical protein
MELVENTQCRYAPSARSIEGRYAGAYPAFNRAGFSMPVSQKLIKELQDILKERYGKEVSFKEASLIGNGLVAHFDLLAKLDYEINEKGGYNTGDEK